MSRTQRIRQKITRYVNLPAALAVVFLAIIAVSIGGTQLVHGAGITLVATQPTNDTPSGSLDKTYTFPISTLPQNSGDILIFSSTIAYSTAALSKVCEGTDTNCSAPPLAFTKAIALNGSNPNLFGEVEIWYAVVPSGSTSTSLSVNWGSSLNNGGTAVEEYTVQEFSAGSGQSWTLDNSAGGAPKAQVDASTSNTINYPSLTPANSGELFVGNGWPAGSANSTVSSGYSAIVTPNANQVVYSTSAPSTSAPVGGQSGSGDTSADALFYPGNGGGGGGGSSISTVGSFYSKVNTNSPNGTNINFSGYSTGARGDLLVLSAMVYNTGESVASVASANVNWQSAATTHKPSSGFGGEVEIWYGIVTAGGPITLTLQLQGSSSGHDLEVNLQEFSAGPSQSWSVDKIGTPIDSAGVNPINYPSITPSSSGPELYFGYLGPWNTPSTTVGTTSGFTYLNTAESPPDQVTYNTNVTGTVSPTTSQNNVSPNTYVSLGVIFTPGSSGGGGGGGGTGGPITTAGSFYQQQVNSSNNTTTLNIPTYNSGDVLVLGISYDDPYTAASITSTGGVISWTKAVQYGSDTNNDDAEIWFGTVVSGGLTANVNISWCGQQPACAAVGSIDNTRTQDFLAQEYTAGAPQYWSVDSTSNATGSGFGDPGNGTGINFPQLTPSTSNNIYFGVGQLDTSFASGSDSGFTYQPTAASISDLFIWNTNVASPSGTPTANQSGNSGYTTAAVILKHSSSGGGTGPLLECTNRENYQGQPISNNFVTTPCNVPYFVEQGGDIASGWGFAGDSGGNACQFQNNGIYFGAFNNDDYNNQGWYGAAAQGAVINPETDQEIVTALNSDTILPNPLSAAFNTPNPYDYNLSPAVYNSPSSSLFYNPSDTADQSPFYLGLANSNQNVDFKPTKSNNQWPVSNISGTPRFQYYGGDFITTYNSSTSPVTQTSPCIPDAYNAASTATGITPLALGMAGVQTADHLNSALSPSNFVVDLNALASGNYSYGSGNSILYINDSGNIMPGKHISLAVKGSVYIASDIKYDPTYNLSNIPLIQISANSSTGVSGNDYATGAANIWVQNTVKELHGFFTAQSSIAGVGNKNAGFHDCAYLSSGNIKQSADYDGTNTGAANSCNNSLSVYGAVEAYYFFLERSYGDLNNPSLPTAATATNVSNAAEVFRYSPELWEPYAASSCTTAGGSGSISRVSGSYQTGGNNTDTNPLNTSNYTPANPNDILVMTIQTYSTGPSGTNVTINNISSGNATWTKATQYYNAATSDDAEIWYGKVNSTTPSSISINWNNMASDPPGHTEEYSVQEFTAGTGQSWGLDVVGTPVDNTSSGSTNVNFASVNPSGGNRLYVGYAWVPGTGSAGSSSGFGYSLTNNNNVIAYSTNAPNPSAPTATESGGTGSYSIAVTFFTGISSGTGACFSNYWQSETALPPVL